MHDPVGYPVNIPLAFRIGPAAAAEILVGHAMGRTMFPGHGSTREELPDDIVYAYRDGTLRQEAVKDNPRLSALGLVNPEHAVALLRANGMYKAACLHDFVGQVSWYAPDGSVNLVQEIEVPQEVGLFAAVRQSTPFKSAYGNVDEFVDELRHSLVGSGCLPDDFDFSTDIVSVVGHYGQT